MPAPSSRSKDRRDSRLTIVIPALNEEQDIGATIRAIPRQDLENKGYAVQILLIDNGSSDRLPTTSP